MELLAAIVLGALLDLCFGDPVRLPHPVVFIGKLIARTEALLRRILPDTKAALRLGGGLLVIIVLAVTGGVGFGLLWLAHFIHPALGFALETFWCYQVLAGRCLADEAGKVRAALETGTLDDARRAVSGLVGRDTQQLSPQGVTKAAVETVAENTSDGVVAPLCFLMLGGAGLGLLYKAVNTMDSMVGYQNDRYRYFGTAAARLDDVCNFIPARLTALLFLAGAALTRRDWRHGLAIWRRDRRKHKSPNSGQPESACAGILGVELGGDASYFGQVLHKSTLGDPLRPIEPADITRTCRLMYLAGGLALLLLGAVRFILCFFL